MPGFHDPNRDLIGRVADLEARVTELARTTGQSISAVRDAENNIVFSPDTVGGIGMSRPYMPFVLRPSNALFWPKIAPDDTEFTVTHTGYVPKTHAQCYVVIWAWAVGPGTVGEIEVAVNEQSYGPLTTTRTQSQGPQGWRYGPLPMPGNFLDEVLVQLSARVIAGSDTVNRTIYVTVSDCYQTELGPHTHGS